MTVMTLRVAAVTTMYIRMNNPLTWMAYPEYHTRICMTLQGQIQECKKGGSFKRVRAENFG